MQNQGNQEFLQSHLEQVNDFAVYDFINDSNFDQFIDFIRGESGDPIVNFTPNYDGEHMFGGEIVDTIFGPIPPVLLEDVFDFNSSTSTSNQNSVPNSLPPFDEDMEIDNGDNNEEDEDDSSENITSTQTTKNPKGDRAKTLVSERKRRSRMKEKLYALRSLVPNITKMDKASIVGDAVSYVQDLQMQAKKIKAEIAGLEASLSVPGQIIGSKENQKEPNSVIKDPKKLSSRQMLQMDLFQVENKEYYVRVVCNKGEGMAVALHKTLESLSPFEIKSSNFSTVSERYVLTFTVDVKECEEEMNAPILKLWVTRALLNQGFEIKAL
ncbi:hypothetical protein ACHQM5_014246 [Ranunculus cassubicifolius]